MHLPMNEGDTEGLEGYVIRFYSEAFWTLTAFYFWPFLVKHYSGLWSDYFQTDRYVWFMLTYAHIRPYTNIHTQAHTHPFTHTHQYTHTHTNKHTQCHTNTPIHSCTHSHSHIHTYTHTHTYIHKQTLKYIHTSISTHPYIVPDSDFPHVISTAKLNYLINKAINSPIYYPVLDIPRLPPSWWRSGPR